MPSALRLAFGVAALLALILAFGFVHDVPPEFPR